MVRGHLEILKTWAIAGYFASRYWLVYSGTMSCYSCNHPQNNYREMLFVNSQCLLAIQGKDRTLLNHYLPSSDEHSRVHKSYGLHLPTRLYPRRTITQYHNTFQTHSHQESTSRTVHQRLVTSPQRRLIPWPTPLLWTVWWQAWKHRWLWWSRKWLLWDGSTFSSRVSCWVRSLIPVFILTSQPDIPFYHLEVKLPFPLTLGFKSMLQRGIETPDMDVRWVSSLSWYFLNFFGLNGLYRLILGDDNCKSRSLSIYTFLALLAFRLPSPILLVLVSSCLVLRVRSSYWLVMIYFNLWLQPPTHPETWRLLHSLLVQQSHPKDRRTSTSFSKPKRITLNLPMVCTNGSARTSRRGSSADMAS